MARKITKSVVWTSSIFCGVGIFAMVMAIELGVGKIREPGPGFFPFIATLFLTGFSATLLIMALLGRTAGVEPFAGVWKRPAVMFVGLLTYAAVINSIGFMIASAFLAILALRILGRNQWWSDVMVGLFLSVGSYFLFSRLLEVPLPKGILIPLL